MMSLEELYCIVDDFCKIFMPSWKKYLIKSGINQRNRGNRLTPSEIMTIMIHFHQSRFRDFKMYYVGFVQGYLKEAFPDLVSYNRFVELMKSVLLPLYFFFLQQNNAKTGIYFIDSTALKVCHIKREHSHKVFKGIAEKSKSTMGWYFGMKLHLIINDCGEIMAFRLTSSKTDDRVPVLKLAEGLNGKLFGDKGYISKELFQKLFEKGMQLITKIRKNMKNKLMPLLDKVLLRKRGLVETVNGQLKNLNQIEHTRHRSIANFTVNLVSGIVAYSLQTKKPSLDINSRYLLAHL